MDSLLYGLTTTLLICVSLIYLFYKYKFSFWRNKRVPYVNPSIPLGNLMKDVHLVYSINKVYNELKGTNSFVGAYIYFSPMIIAIDLDFVKNILVKDFHSFTDRGIYYNEKDDPLSANLFAVDGEKWKNLRIKMTSTFTSGKLKDMFKTIVQVANEFQSVLNDTIKIEYEIEMKDLFARFMTDVIGTCAFGIECNCLRNPDAEFRKYGTRVLELPRFGLFKRIFTASFRHLSHRLHLKVLDDDVSEFFFNIVRETVKYREDNKIRRNDFMDLLIDLKNNKSLDETGTKLGQLTLEEIAAQAVVFFLAGYETSATSLTYVTYELAINESIQIKAREEINSILSKHNGEISYETLKEMIYLDRIVNESLRKYPPISTLLRRATENYSTSDGQIIEKDSLVLIPVYSIHHDPEIYPNPEIFDPERFTPDAVKLRHHMAFIPFGDGPRNCIGLRFAKIQSKIGLAVLLKNFKFSVCSKTPKDIKFMKNSLTLSSEGGMWLKVEKL